MSLLRRLLVRAAEPLGRRGEKLAAKFLKRHRYRILERNLPIHDDEADLVALDPDGRTIVVVEVKTRIADGMEDEHLPPELAVTRTKQFHVARLAARLQQSRRYKDRPFRFDVIAVVVPPNGEPVIRHHPGAFQSPW